jgi:hypothetical protein
MRLVSCLPDTFVLRAQPRTRGKTRANAEACRSLFPARGTGKRTAAETLAVPLAGCSSSACIVDRDGVAIRVLERERPAEGAIDRLGQDRDAVLDELVMKGLGVVGPQP